MYDEHMFAEAVAGVAARGPAVGGTRWSEVAGQDGGAWARAGPGDAGASNVDIGTTVVEWQPSLFASGDLEFDPELGGMRRIELDETSWVDHLPRWLSGSDHVFAELVARLPWSQRTVPMYERMVLEPRLTWWWSEGNGAIPVAVLDAARATLSAHYDRPFDSMGCNYYRGGQDSVAWHGDRVRHHLADPVVVVLSVGAPRPFLLRPRGGGRSVSFLLGQGDLLVMGGATQHDWEHTVPKVATAGPRISITYRHGVPAPPGGGGRGAIPEPEADRRARAAARRQHPSGAHDRHLATTGSVNPVGTLSRTSPRSRPSEIRPLETRSAQTGRPDNGRTPP